MCRRLYESRQQLTSRSLEMPFWPSLWVGVVADFVCQCLFELIAGVVGVKYFYLLAEKLLHAPSGSRIGLDWLVDAPSPSFGALESTPFVVKLVDCNGCASAAALKST